MNVSFPKLPPLLSTLVLSSAELIYGKPLERHFQVRGRKVKFICQKDKRNGFFVKNINSTDKKAQRLSSVQGSRYGRGLCAERLNF